MIRKILVFPIMLYQWIIRPLFPNSCVFEPSCSEYTQEAIMKYGVIKGAILGARRISRCHPWQKDRFDPLV